MGFLTVNGMLMTYDEYKEKINCYRTFGLLQFAKLYGIHKDRQIENSALHWGEEIEYHLYTLDKDKNTAKLSCDASDILRDFNQILESSVEDPGFKLLPEFGNWMIEAVPSFPYKNYADPNNLLSCFEKISTR